MSDQNKGSVQIEVENQVEELKNALARGDIVSEVEILQRLTSILAQSSSSDKSTIQPPVMRLGDILMRDQLVGPMRALERDLQLLKARLDKLEQTYTQFFNLCTAELQGLKSSASKLLEYYDSAVLDTAEGDPNVLWAFDGFRSLDKTDLTLTTANVDIDGGVLTLGIESEENIAPQSKVVVVPSSAVGVPGCNHLVGSINYGTNPDVNHEPEVALAPGSETALQPINVLDGNPSTRFDWEVNIVPRNQKLVKYGASYIADDSGKEEDIYKVTSGYGFTMFISWDGTNVDRGPGGKGFKTMYLSGNDGKDQDGKDIPTEATCELQFLFDDVKSISAVKVLPGLVSGGPVIVDRISVTTNGVDWIPITTAPTALTPEVNDLTVNYASRLVPIKTGGSTALFWISPVGSEGIVGVRGISMVLRHRYVGDSVLLAHKYYAQVDEVKVTKRIFLFRKSHIEKRITRQPGPEVVTSLYNTTTSALAKAAAGFVAFGPVGAILSQIPVIGDAFAGVASLFYNKKTEVLSSKMLEAYDVFRGIRHAVSIKDVQLLSRRYKQNSVYVSKPFVFSEPVRSLTLSVLSNVPREFSSGQWLRYYVSVNGEDWIECENDKTVSISPSKEVYVKIELSRPVDLPGFTPVVYNYSIAAVPAEGA